VEKQSSTKKTTKDNHLCDEHGFAAKAIRQTAKAYSADENAEEASCADDAVFSGADVKFA
jgi:hypothetical protein